MAQTFPNNVQAEKAKSSFPAPPCAGTQPGPGTRRRLSPHMGEVPGWGGASWIFMSREFADQKAQSCFPL